MRQPVSRWHEFAQSAGQTGAASADGRINSAAPFDLASTTSAQAPAAPSGLVRGVVRVFKLLAEAAALLALLSLFFIRLPQVSGHSMEPQLRAGDHVLINTLAYSFRAGEGVRPFIDVRLHAIARDDVIAFAHVDGSAPQVYVKRVIALPGDMVAISGGMVSVNGRVLHEAYVSHRDATNMPATRVPLDTYFVLGDNRAESDDSRVFGGVPRSAVIGRAALIVWPLNRAGRLR